MKIPELTNSNITAYLKLDDFKDLDKRERQLIEAIKEAAFSYLVDMTGLTAEQVEEKDTLTIAYLSLIQDTYDNRALQIDKNNMNKTVETIIGMYDFTLI